MKIRLLSDLHTEFRLPYKTEPLAEYRGEDVLVLAGDIASGATNTLDVLKFFKSQGYKHVVYVPGNHEYYGTSIEAFDEKLILKTQGMEGVHFLNPGVVQIDDVLFVGANLWTNFRENNMAPLAASAMIADFRYIKGFSTDKAKELHYKHLDFIKQQYEDRGTKTVVVVTHFLPATQCISPRFENPKDLLNYYFANDLGEYIESMSDAVWMFGHTHDVVDKRLGTTRVVANPHGYYTAKDEGQDFNPFKTIVV